MEIRSPVPGRAIPLADVPDPVFAGQMVGPGVGIDPTREAGVAVAPVSGTVVKLHPHAFVISGSAGSVLVHLGIDTVQLKGEGFGVLISEGAAVSAGDPVVSWDPVAIESGGKSPTTPVVALEGTVDALRAMVTSGEVAVGDVLFIWG